jgi:DHA1 family inner membrane transport protein
MLDVTQGAAAPVKAPQGDVARPLIAMGVGSFAVGTSEFVIMGLLPEVSADLAISIPQAGHTISAYALGVVIGAPILALLGAKISRRIMLIILMSLFTAGNLASAFSSDYHWMMAMRFLSGFPHGTYFGIAALVAASLVPAHKRAQAVAMAMLGLSLATLIGVPLAAALGQWLGWRAAFVLVALIALLSAVMIYRWLPPTPRDESASPWAELSALGNKQVWLTLGIGAIGFGGMFAVFSYVKPSLMALAGLTEAGVPLVLALFGAGMVVGNIFGSKMADKNLMGSIRVTLIWSAAVLGAFVLSAHVLWIAFINVFLIGTVVAIGPALQIRLMDVAGKAQTLAAALNHSAFNFANAIGALLGGFAIDLGLGWSSTGWVGLVLSIAGLGIYNLAKKDSLKNG